MYYFYYNDGKTKFMKQKPNENFKEIGMITWRQLKQKICLCCQLEWWNNENKKPITWRTQICKFTKKHIPILKSNLQKCIRRGLCDKAIKSAYTLLYIDPNHLLRRLPIIMLEDVTITEDLPELVWLMCAVSKKIKITDNIAFRILYVVQHLSYLMTKTDYHIESPSINILMISQKQKYKAIKHLILALELRKSYGGLKGDMKMIKNYIYLLYTQNIIIEQGHNSLINKNWIKIVEKKDIIPESIDFHCTNIIQRIRSDIPYYSKTEIKDLLWICRSSINIRKKKKLKESVNKQFQKIKVYVEVKSQDIIKQLF